MSTAVKTNEETVEDFELKSTVELNDAKDFAKIKYDESSYNDYIGPELEKALQAIGKATDAYFGLVVDDSTKQTKALLEEHETLKIVEAVAPIYSKDRNDKLEILNVRDEIEDEENPLDTLNVKIIQNVSKPIVIQSAAALLRKNN